MCCDDTDKTMPTYTCSGYRTCCLASLSPRDIHQENENNRILRCNLLHHDRSYCAMSCASLARLAVNISAACAVWGQSARSRRKTMNTSAYFAFEKRYDVHINCSTSDEMRPTSSSLCIKSLMTDCSETRCDAKDLRTEQIQQVGLNQTFGKRVFRSRSLELMLIVLQQIHTTSNAFVAKHSWAWHLSLVISQTPD